MKFQKLEESIRAFESLQSKYTIAFVPTKIDSDRANQYKHLITESQDDAQQEASYTLNLLKIQNEDQKPVTGG